MADKEKGRTLKGGQMVAVRQRGGEEQAWEGRCALVVWWVERFFI